ncbi:hypothetical protein K0M31_006128 [Melipona bicolor]|uniref:Uncharacterized protein n=1 Tax=Melipona bicolor TaxID=60889 RepID=A0AA40KLP9_9HYME|nr:hypothetical protein K0M31_006128 [Melipona bicolor]
MQVQQFLNTIRKRNYLEFLPPLQYSISHVLNRLSFDKCVANYVFSFFASRFHNLVVPSFFFLSLAIMASIQCERNVEKKRKNETRKKNKTKRETKFHYWQLH